MPVLLLRPAPPPEQLTAAAAAALVSYDHTQQAIGRADTKASLVVTAQAAVLGYLLTQPFPTAGAGRVLFIAGAGLLLAALALAGAAVYPRLTRRAAGHGRDGVYWGEIALTWTPEALAQHLARQDPAQRLETLTRQLVAVAKVSWRKHRLLQASLLVSLAAAGALAAAYLV